MNKKDSFPKDLFSFLREKEIYINKNDYITKHIKICYKNDYLELKFPHKYIYEMYHNNIKTTVEDNIYKKIFHVIEKNSKISDLNNNNFEKNNHTFNNYIPGNKNKLPLDLCKEIALSNSIKYNPVIIYGDTSTGKSHLINAIIKEKNNSNIKKIDSFEFTLNFKLKNIKDLYNDLKTKDIIIFENINNLIKNKEYQVLVEKIIDYIHEMKKQIILTYCGNTISYQNISQGLKSRIQEGLSIKLTNPDMNVRICYVRRFCREHKIKLSNDNIFTISKSCYTIRAVKGVLLKINSMISRNGSISSREINALLKEKENINIINLSDILISVSQIMNVSSKDIISKARGKNISLARQICMYICKKKLNWSYSKIGSKFGDRNHSTAIYSVKKIQKLKTINMEIDIMLRNMFQKIESQEKMKI